MIKLLLLLSLVVSIYAGPLKRADRYYQSNNTKKAIEYYKKACNEGITQGCDKYNELQSPITKAFTLISQSKGEEAMPYLKQACQEGYSWACTMYESSTGESITLPKGHTFK
jgi:TPR repeat protein